MNLQGRFMVKALVLTGLLYPAISGFAQTSISEHAGEPTAQNQGESTADRQLTQNIRRAITQDRNLSTSAHNVKIISQNGVVTLKGQVPSEEDKAAVEAKAVELAGKDRVVSEITVASQQK